MAPTTGSSSSASAPSSTPRSSQPSRAVQRLNILDLPLETQHAIFSHVSKCNSNAVSPNLGSVPFYPPPPRLRSPRDGSSVASWLLICCLRLFVANHRVGATSLTPLRISATLPSSFRSRLYRSASTNWPRPSSIGRSALFWRIPTLRREARL